MTHLGLRRRVVGIAFSLALVLSGCFVGTTTAATQYCPTVRDKDVFGFYQLRSEIWKSHGSYMVDIYGKYEVMFSGGVPSGVYRTFYCTTIYP